MFEVELKLLILFQIALLSMNMCWQLQLLLSGLMMMMLMLIVMFYDVVMLFFECDVKMQMKKLLCT